jgi:hypothetical protein
MLRNLLICLLDINIDLVLNLLLKMAEFIQGFLASLE